MGSSLPTAQCSPGRTGGDRVSRKRRHPQRRDRWGSSTLSPQPYWLVAAGWGEPTTRSCSPSLAPHTAEGREAMVTRCPGEQRGGRNAQAPREGHPPGSPSPIARPTAAPGGRFPAQLTSAAASAPRGARLPEPGRAGETQGMAPGRAPRAADGSPQSTTQHREKPRSTLHTSQARSAGVQARARLAQALPAPEDKQRGT